MEVRKSSCAIRGLPFLQKHKLYELEWLFILCHLPSFLPLPYSLAFIWMPVTPSHSLAPSSKAALPPCLIPFCFLLLSYLFFGQYCNRSTAYKIFLYQKSCCELSLNSSPSQLSLSLLLPLGSPGSSASSLESDFQNHRCCASCSCSVFVFLCETHLFGQKEIWLVTQLERRNWDLALTVLKNMRHKDEGGETKTRWGKSQKEERRLQAVKVTLWELFAFPLLAISAEFRFSYKTRACLTVM